MKLLALIPALLLAACATPPPALPTPGTLPATLVAQQEQVAAEAVAAAPAWVKPVATMHCRRGSDYGAPRPPGATGSAITHYHTGLDLGPRSAGVYYGNPVRAMHAGTVVAAGWSGGGGWRVRINHGGRVATTYMHLRRFIVHVGQHVVAGQTIGYVGSSGDATGPHLHVEVLVNGLHVNPGPYLAARGVRLVC